MQKFLFFFNTCLILLSNLHLTTAQNIVNPIDTLVLEQKQFIAGDFSWASADAFNSIFVLNSNNQLVKYNALGDAISAFNGFSRYGKPTFIDVSNPMKILVYFQRFSTILILDRWLTLRNTLKLKFPGSNASKTIACSYDNNIWIFHQLNQQLLKLDEQLNIASESNDIRSLTGEVINPAEIKDAEGWVLLNDNNKGIYLFDQLGTFKKQLPFQWNNITIQNKSIYGFANNLMHEYHLQTQEEKAYHFPHNIEDCKSVQFINHEIVELKKEGVHVYSIKN